MFERNFIILRKNVTSSLCKCNMLISLFTRSHFYWNLAVFNKQLVWICQRKFRRALSWGNFTLHWALTSLYRHENMSSAFSPTSSFSIFSLSFLENCYNSGVLKWPSVGWWLEKLTTNEGGYCYWKSLYYLSIYFFL